MYSLKNCALVWVFLISGLYSLECDAYRTRLPEYDTLHRDYNTATDEVEWKVFLKLSYNK